MKPVTLAIALLAGSPYAASVAAAPVQQFGNASLSASWTVTGKSLGQFVLNDLVNRREIALAAPFALTMRDGRRVSASDLVIAAPPRTVTLRANSKAARKADRDDRHAVQARLLDPAGAFAVDWSLVQGKNAKYLRQSITITAIGADASIARVDLFETQIAGSEIVGRVAGSPVVAGNIYFQFEHPLSKSSAGAYDGKVALWIDRALPLKRGQSVTYSAAAGTAAPGQLRRDFLAYIESERAHPSRPYLHYNSWYDIGFQTRYTEAEALDRIRRFGEQLTAKRSVKLDAFLFDDGWDDRSGSWRFSKAFPNGFKPLRDAAAKHGAAPGVWLSPWGGYDGAKRERIAHGRRAGYEIVDDGFALSGPFYYEQFRAATLALTREHGVTMLKLDGTGNADRVVPGSAFPSDFDAAIALIEDLRHQKPELFINLTTGTYPSPAWLRYADTIWRGGEDHGYTGPGSQRQRWITYRDRETYAGIVMRGPLFPLNAVMTHGIIYAQHTPSLGTDPQNDFADEVRSFFGSGTGLQELYITPSLLTAANWDVLAEAARWARDNADIFADSHWIGGDPGRLDVYGWAAWSPRKAIVTLRNPASTAQSFALDLDRILESPPGAARSYRVTNLWGSRQPSVAATGEARILTLKPFEVVTLEFDPIR